MNLPTAQDSVPAAFAANVNQYVNEYIKFADAKAAGILSVVSVVGAALGIAAPIILATAKSVHFALFLLGFLACGVVALAVLGTLWRCLDSVSPRLPEAGKSLASFTDISQATPSDYTRDMLQITPEAVAQQYVVHNIVLSRIATAKFAAIAKATWWMRIALCAAYVATLTYGVSAAVTSKYETSSDVDKGCHVKSPR